MISNFDDLVSVKGLKIAHLNIRSLPAKIDQLRILLLNEPVDIMCITETWTNSNHTPALLNIPG